MVKTQFLFDKLILFFVFFIINNIRVYPWLMN